MAISFPADLGWISDLIIPSSCTMDLQRNEETSGVGSGQFWSAELAEPLWTAQVGIPRFLTHAEGRAFDAKMRRLGTNRTLLFADPMYKGLDQSGVVISSFSTDRTAITLSGLAPGTDILAGHRLSVVYGGHIWFAEFDEDVTADDSGVAGPVAVYPFPPMILAAGAVVELAKPYLKMMLVDAAASAALPGNRVGEKTLTLRQKP
ncbi:hypothetical protein [Thioclava sp. GXIMD4216]|uniref:hypothetical protein n=1 Tax=Thioclava sp. GXIMD4216 TaxID=3131929 RepID=UPI0030D621CA